MEISQKVEVCDERTIKNEFHFYDEELQLLLNFSFLYYGLSRLPNNHSRETILLIDEPK